MNCIFGKHIDIEIFYKLILSFYVCVIRHARSAQNKFTYFSNISRKAWEINLIFCLQINISFLQLDSITLGVLSQVCSKYSKQQVYTIFAISQGNVNYEVDFLPANKRQRFLQNGYCHFRCVWPGMPKLTKITSLLFLCNIVRKK